MLAQILYYLKSASGVLTAAGVFFWKNTPGEKNSARQDSAARFGPEIQFPRLSLAFSLILSGVPQIEVSFGKIKASTDT